jgi:hypothetical protein
MALAIEIAERRDVQWTIEPAQPGRDRRGFAQEVGAGIGQPPAVLRARRPAHRCHQRRIPLGDDPGDAPPHRLAADVDGHDARVPARQPSQRTGFAAGAQQDQRAVGQVEPLRVLQAAMQRTRRRRFDDAACVPFVDARLERRAFQPLPAVRDMPGRRPRIAVAAEHRRLEGCRRPHKRVAQRACAILRDEMQAAPGRGEPGACARQRGLR